MLLDELRELVREVEVWAKRERDPRAEAAAQLLGRACDSQRVTLVHWDDVDGFDVPDDVRPLGGRWQRLADAAGSVRIGAHRVQLEAGRDDHAAARALGGGGDLPRARRLGDAVAGRLDLHRRAPATRSSSRRAGRRTR